MMDAVEEIAFEISDDLVDKLSGDTDLAEKCGKRDEIQALKSAAMIGDSDGEGISETDRKSVV